MTPIRSLDQLIEGCRRKDSRAQEELYSQYKGVLYAVCCRYIQEQDAAEDVFIQAFYKIFLHIADFRGTGSFEGWMRRIMVNECLMFIRKEHNLHLTVALTDQEIAVSDEPENKATPYSYEELMAVIDMLPTGYRTVFNLYVIEEFKHREIAEMLGISINTSKSQFILARKKILELIKKRENYSELPR